MKVRVQLEERWDRLGFDVSSSISVATLKREALDAFGLAAAAPADYVVKLRGWPVLDEQRSVGDSGALDGATFLMAYCRRRPVR